MWLAILLALAAAAWIRPPGGGIGLPDGAVPLESGLFPPGGLADLDWQETTVTINLNTVGQLVPSSASRVYLFISMPPGGATTTCGTRQSLISATVGQVMNQTTPLQKTWSSDGPAVSQAWYGRPTATTTFLVQQAFYSPKRG